MYIHHVLDVAGPVLQLLGPPPFPPPPYRVSKEQTYETQTRVKTAFPKVFHIFALRLHPRTGNRMAAIRLDTQIFLSCDDKPEAYGRNAGPSANRCPQEDVVVISSGEESGHDDS